MIYNVVLVQVYNRDSVILVSIVFRFFSYLGYYSVLSRVLCAIQ